MANMYSRISFLDDKLLLLQRFNITNTVLLGYQFYEEQRG